MEKKVLKRRSTVELRKNFTEKYMISRSNNEKKRSRLDVSKMISDSICKGDKDSELINDAFGSKLDLITGEANL